MTFIKFLTELKDPKISEVGGKGYSLAVLINNGFNVPQGFVITSDAFFKFLKANNLMERIEKLASEIDENTFLEKSKGIRDLILDGNMPKDIASQIEEPLNKIDAQYVSIRSSAVSEDSLKASFAGLHDTFLNIKSEPDLVLENIKKCWASLFTERAIVYRIRKGIPHLEGMAVVVQEMIPAEVSGITFTVHPTKEKTLLIEASYGIGDMVVSGKVEPDDYVVDRGILEVLEKKIGDKNIMSICRSGQVEIIGVEKELANKQVIHDERIKEVAKICLNIEKLFKYPQDIEWCISNKKIWILQSRAITGEIK